MNDEQVQAKLDHLVSIGALTKKHAEDFKLLLKRQQDKDIKALMEQQYDKGYVAGYKEGRSEK